MSYHGYSVRNTTTMFRAIGLILLIWFLSGLFSGSFQALDSAATETFRALEAAAVNTQDTFK